MYAYCLQKNTSSILFLSSQTQDGICFFAGFCVHQHQYCDLPTTLAYKNTVSKNPIMVQLIFGKNEGLVLHIFWKISVLGFEVVPTCYY